MENRKLGNQNEKKVVGTGENLPRKTNEIETNKAELGGTATVAEFQIQDEAPIKRKLGFCALSFCSTLTHDY